MSAIVCPKCSRRLRINKAPDKEIRLQCPYCSHYFQIAPAKAREGQDEPEQAARPAALLAWPIGAALGAVALVGLAALGIFFWSMSTGEAPKPDDQPIAQQPKEPAPKPPEPERKSSADQEIKPELTDKKEAADKDKLDVFLGLMIRGGTSFEGKRFDEAAAAYARALRIFPDDARAKQKLEEAQAAAASQAAVKKEDDKTKMDLALLLKQADDAYAKKQFAAAIEIYKLALQRAPGDSAAARGVVAAQEALTKDLAEQKKLADYQKHMTAGKTALKAEVYAEAKREFQAALLVLPDNVEAAALLRLADKELAAVQDDAQKKKDYLRFMDQAQTALRTQHFDDALQSYQMALKVFPNDKNASKGFVAAQQAAKIAQIDFNSYLNKGTQAMRDGRFQDAVFAFREAGRILPGNQAAAKALREAEQVYQNQVNYSQSMKLALAAMVTQRYGDAVLQYQEALKANPGDQLANQGLLDARKQYEEDLRRKTEFDRKLQTALALEKQQNYAEANKQFTEAAKLVPNHPQILAVQQKARYTDAMAKGTASMKARKYAEAVPFFQAALKEYPMDFVAKNNLVQASNLSKFK